MNVAFVNERTKVSEKKKKEYQWMEWKLMQFCTPARRQCCKSGNVRGPFKFALFVSAKNLQMFTNTKIHGRPWELPVREQSHWNHSFCGEYSRTRTVSFSVKHGQNMFPADSHMWGSIVWFSCTKTDCQLEYFVHVLRGSWWPKGWSKFLYHIDNIWTICMHQNHEFHRMRRRDKPKIMKVHAH